MKDEEKRAVKYEARDKQQISLSFDDCRKFLVSGKPGLVTDQELIYFLQICKSKGLNPFKKDVYLVKFSQDPAAIIVSIDYLRSRARARPDCKGWNKGIIVREENGNIRYSKGLLLEGETLLGGWFRATPENWLEPFELEVNLAGYLKKTSEGKLTRFWKEENQPTMIAKVAEAQGLRTLWPDEFQQLYVDAEASQGDTITAEFSEVGKDAEKAAVDFDKNIPKGVDMAMLGEFLAATATSGKATVAEVKKEAMEKPKEFWTAFSAWCEKKKGKALPDAKSKGKADEKKGAAGKKDAKKESPEKGQAEPDLDPINNEKDFLNVHAEDKMAALRELLKKINVDEDLLEKPIEEMNEKQLIKIWKWANEKSKGKAA